MSVIKAWALAIFLIGCASAPQPPLEVVPSVNLSRYVGKWYEIASFPTWFQKGCAGSTAEYSLRPDGGIGVLNQCIKAPDGAPDSARGIAWVVDPVTNAKLRVRFFWPFSGDYWIVDLDPDYQWVLVGEPKRNYLWILARTSTLDKHLYESIVKRAAGQGFDVARLIATRHNP